MTFARNAVFLVAWLVSTEQPPAVVFGSMGPTLLENNLAPLRDFAHAIGQTLWGFKGNPSYSQAMWSNVAEPERYYGVVFFSPDSTTPALRQGWAAVVTCAPFGDEPSRPVRPVVACEWTQSGDHLRYAQVSQDPDRLSDGSLRAAFPHNPFFVDEDLSESEILGVVRFLLEQDATAEDARLLAWLLRHKDGMVASMELDTVTTREVRLSRSAEGWLVADDSIRQE